MNAEKFVKEAQASFAEIENQFGTLVEMMLLELRGRSSFEARACSNAVFSYALSMKRPSCSPLTFEYDLFRLNMSQ